MKQLAPLLLAVALGPACASDSQESSNLLDDHSVIYPNPDWATAEPAALGFDSAALDELAKTADGNDSHCLVVTRKGRIVAEWYWDGWTAESEQVVFSATKSFTSTLVGIAQDQGRLSIHDPASKYISEWQGGASAAVTVQQLLSNSSGREWSFLTDYVRMAAGASDKTQFAIDLGQDHDPGSYWEYNNSAIQTLERVLKVSLGVSDVADYARTNLLEPIGMKSHMGHDGAGNSVMFADLSASCRDLARFGYLFLRKGEWADGKRIVSEAWVAEATSISTELNSAYGYLWWLNQPGHYVLPSSPGRREGDGKQMPALPDTTFAALGLGGQVIGVDPEHEIVFTRIGGSADVASTALSGADLTGLDVVTVLSEAVAKAIVK
ncbi:MAG: serine hydrolase domain-containing protein [Myxococcales bacterium]